MPRHFSGLTHSHIGMYKYRHGPRLDDLGSLQRDRGTAPSSHPRVHRRRRAIGDRHRRRARARSAVGVEAPAGAARRRAGAACGGRGGGRCIGSTRRHFARFTIGAACSRGTGADSCDGSRHTPRRNDDDDHGSRPARHSPSPRRFWFARHSRRRSLRLIAQMGRLNETPDGKPLPMVLEPRPGGRWYRDLGGDNGHLWGFVQSIKRPALLEIWGPLFMSTAATSNLMYRLTEVEGGSLITFTHTLVGPFPEDHRPQLGLGVGRAARAGAQGCGNQRRRVEETTWRSLTDCLPSWNRNRTRLGACSNACRRRTCRGGRIRSRCRSASSRCTSRRCRATSPSSRRWIRCPSRRRSCSRRRQRPPS